MEANELAFMHKSEADKAVPKKLLDACDFIDDLFSETSWKSKLAKNKKLLDDVFSKKSVVAAIGVDEIR